MFKVIRTGPPRPLNEAQASGLPTARYELLDVLEFTSKRKRMSVIMRDTSDPGRSRIVLWSKGADSVVYSRLCSSYTHNGEGGGDGKGGGGEDGGGGGGRDADVCVGTGERVEWVLGNDVSGWNQVRVILSVILRVILRVIL